MTKKLNILAIMPSLIPSTIIGIIRPLAQLNKNGEVNLRVRLNRFSFGINSDLKWSDVVVFCRNCETDDLDVLYKCKSLGKKIVYEVDDNFEEIPLTTYIGIYHRAFFRLHTLKRFFQLSNITRVYSDRMVERAKAHDANVQHIKSYFDIAIINGLKKNLATSKIKIAYPTGRIDDQELEDRIFGAVRKILEIYKGRVEFHIWRKEIPVQLKNIEGVVKNKIVSSYDSFVKEFYVSNYSIGLAPANNTPFFHSKTNNKYREFGGCEVAGVYSNFPPYSNSVVNEEGGLLVGDNQYEWFSAIERLILDNELRLSIAKCAKDDILQNYSFEKAVESWRDCFKLLDFESDNQKWWNKKVNVRQIHIALLGERKQLNSQLDYSLKAADSLRNTHLVVHENLDAYLYSPLRFRACCMLFIVGSIEELRGLSELAGLVKNGYIDISSLQTNQIEALKFIRSSSLKDINVLLSEDNKNFSSELDHPKEILVNTNIPKFYQTLSTNGYASIYMDIFEKSIDFSELDVIKFQRFSKIGEKMVALNLMYANRMKLVWIYVKLRFGIFNF